jgi:hypothetical protein
MHPKRAGLEEGVDEGGCDRPLTQGGVPLYGALGVERISLTAHLQRGPYHVDRRKRRVESFNTCTKNDRFWYSN